MAGQKVLFVTLACTLTCVAGGLAFASGFALREGSADWTANAYAGGAAKAYDASTAWANPAGMTRLDSPELDVSGSYIDPYSHFNGLDAGAAGLVSGRRSVDGLDPGATAGVYGVWGYSPDLKFGLAGGAPFASRVDYPTNWVGRYQSLVSMLTDIELQLSAAYRINDHFSVGGGPVFDYLSTRTSQAINAGAINALGDPTGSLEGSDVAVGFDLGALIEVTKALRFGVNYRSRITHNITEQQSVFVPPMISAASPIAGAMLSAMAGRTHTEMTLPDSVDVGAYWDLTPSLALVAELQWTNWSLLNTLNSVPVNADLPTQSLSLHWHDSWFGSIGMNYRLFHDFMVQTGVGFDESPVRNGSRRLAGFPDTDRVVLGAGFTYNVIPNFDVMFGYAHQFGLTAPVNSVSNATGGQLVGTMQTHFDSFSVGARAKF